jgi:hypothetical protein
MTSNPNGNEKQKSGTGIIGENEALGPSPATTLAGRLPNWNHGSRCLLELILSAVWIVTVVVVLGGCAIVIGSGKVEQKVERQIEINPEISNEKSTSDATPDPKRVRDQ